MKVTLRIPTQDQYAFVEVEMEGPNALEPEEMKTVYDGLIKAFKTKATVPGDGLDSKAFNAALDRYLTDGTGDIEMWQKMNSEQQNCFQHIKRSMKRIEAKNGKDVTITNGAYPKLRDY